MLAPFAKKTETKILPGSRGLKRARFEDAYITAGYAKAIQDEQRKLMKAMFKAKEQGSEANVVGRSLYIGEIKYDVTNIPEDFE